MNEDLRIAVVGGGIAGLATGSALTHAGFKPEVFEQAPLLGEVGAGVNISAQVVKIFQAIGIYEKALSLSNVIKGTTTRDSQTGKEISYISNEKSEKKYGVPSLCFHRADLVDAVAAGMNPASIHLGHRLMDIEDTGKEVHLTFANGAKRTVDLVVAADGVHSLIRRTIHGVLAPRYTGQMAWRAMLQGKDVPTDIMGPAGNIRWVGPGVHLNCYYMRGTQLINLTGQVDNEEWVEESWTAPGKPEEMRAHFGDAEPGLAKVLSLVDKCSKWGLFARPANRDWGKGRIQLIGDAAHPMLPNAGQGAAQGIEDGYILSRWLKAEADPVVALEKFRAVRIPRVEGVQRRSAVNAKIYHMTDTSRRDAMLTQTEFEGRDGSDVAGMNWIVGFDPINAWNKIPDVPVIEAAL